MSRPDFQATDWTYVMGGPLLQSQNWPALATVAPGTQLTKLPLRTDTDAPFLLRSIAARVQYDPTFPLVNATQTHRQTGLNSLLFRFTSPTGDYLQQARTPFLLQTPWAGQMGNPMPLQRQVYYPAGSVIQVDITNFIVNPSAAKTFTNLTLYFRGVKMWPWGVRRWYPYPRNAISMLPYAYTFGLSPVEFPTLYNIPVTQPAGTPYRLQMRFDQDGDFVLRSLQAGPSVLVNNVSWEVFFRFKDSDEYPYSNDFIQADVIAGNGGGPVSFPTGNPTGSAGGAGVFQPAFQIGPGKPGLFFPEVYIPNHQYMWLEISRNDSAFVSQGAVAQDFPVVLQGAKVFQRG